MLFRSRHAVAVDRVAARVRARTFTDAMRDDLVAVEIEIDPFHAASPLGAAEQVAIKLPGSGKIADRKGKMKRTK